eukprot:Nitzschia sp. Nitz4//scaffold146_size56529//10442//10866//NITZ4_006570-RA/size56529-augustus-gene-0.2-mRNA-1//-1//CDS//3329536617//772//frame0
MTSAATITLYRTMLRQAKQMNDYNFRSHAVRRVKAGFHQNKALTGEEATAAFQEGEKQLQVLQRQVIIGKLYPSARSVMES